MSSSTSTASPPAWCNVVEKAKPNSKGKPGRVRKLDKNDNEIPPESFNVVGVPLQVTGRLTQIDTTKFGGFLGVELSEHHARMLGKKFNTPGTKTPLTWDNGRENTFIKAKIRPDVVNDVQVKISSGEYKKYDMFFGKEVRVTGFQKTYSFTDKATDKVVSGWNFQFIDVDYLNPADAPKDEVPASPEYSPTSPSYSPSVPVVALEPLEKLKSFPRALLKRTSSEIDAEQAEVEEDEEESEVEEVKPKKKSKKVSRK